MAGNPLPRNEFEPAGAVRDVGFAAGDLLGLGPGRRAEDDHPGAEAIAGVVKEGARPDQQTFCIEVMMNR